MYILKFIFFPPGINFVLFITALVFWKKRKLARNLIITSLILLYLSSITLVSDPFLRTIEYPPLNPDTIASLNAKAIVVLGADRYSRAPEYQKDTVASQTLQRVRYAAWLAKKTGLPILVSGGSKIKGAQPEALLMQQVLETELGVKAPYLEVYSHNTYENAVCSKQILETINADKILLVTQAWHMPRAIRSFNDAGIQVIPASTGYTTSNKNGVSFGDLLPSARGLARTNIWLHELFGILWYNIKYIGSNMDCPKRADQI